MKKIKAFTLIELLAVIIILAILALIVSPIISGVIKDSKKAAAARSVEGYIKAVELAQVKYQANHLGAMTTELSALPIEYSGTLLKDISITFNENGTVESAIMTVNGYTCEYEKGEVKTCNKQDEDNMEYTDASCFTTDADIYVIKDINTCVSTYIDMNALTEDICLAELGESCTSYATKVCNDEVGYNNQMTLLEFLLEQLEFYPDDEYTQYMIESLGGLKKLNIQKENVKITNYDSSCGENVVIPKTINGSNVVAIGNGAFINKGLKSVYIPNTVISIGTSAFRENQLTSVTIGNSVTTIETSAFNGNQLTSVTIPDSVTIIERNAFSGNNLTSVTIGKSVTSIGVMAFFSNQLTNVEIPDSVTHIGNDAFSGNLGINIINNSNVPYSN